MNTIDAISQQFGVSRFTVARILEGRSKGRWGAARDQAEAIRAAAERLGWRPNAAARAMKKGSFSTIGLVVRGSQPVLNRDLFFAMMERCEELDLSLQLVKLPEALPDGSVERLRWLREHSLDGMAIDWSANMDPGQLAAIEAIRLPVVWINQNHGAAAVYPEEQATFESLTRRLIAGGFRRILFVDASASWNGATAPGHYSLEARRMGYRNAMQAAGLEPRLVQLARYQGDVEGDLARLEQALPQSDAAFVLHEMAMARIHALVQRVMPRLPILAFGRDAADPWSPWTCIRQPWNAVGRAAVDQIVSLIAGGDPQRQAIPYDVEAIRLPLPLS